MKYRPILFSAPMVRALLDSTKTQTRRVVKPRAAQDLEWFGGKCDSDDDRETNEILGQCLEKDGLRVYSVDYPEEGSVFIRCPYGQPGDRLWVRETFLIADSRASNLPPWVYAADYTDDDRPRTQWKPSIHMPRWASRIALEITGVRVERLQDISEDDCWAEGIEQVMHDFDDASQCVMAKRIGASIEDAKPLYAQLWQSINGPGSWDANPWVWVVEFKVVKP